MCNNSKNMPVIITRSLKTPSSSWNLAATKSRISYWCSPAHNTTILLRNDEYMRPAFSRPRPVVPEAKTSKKSKYDNFYLRQGGYVFARLCLFCAVRSGLYSADDPSFSQLVEDMDDNLFAKIHFNPHHVLYKLLPEKTDHSYNLRPRSHSFTLSVKTDSRNYIKRMLFKDIY